MSLSLVDLPPELLAHIVSYAENTWTLLCLALCCKKLNDYIQRDGYRVFVQSHFPSIPIPPSWKDAAHALTTRRRAWDRKSLTARYLYPPQHKTLSQPTNHGRRARGQTIGYQPIIDSYESWTGSEWSSRKEVVAWGAGTELILRIKWMGPKSKEIRRQNALKGGPPMELDQHHHVSQWWNIKQPSYRDGKDDITAIKLLHEAQRPSEDSEYIVVGRANGELEVIRVEHTTRDRWERVTKFVTNGRAVRFLSTNSAVPPLLAACLDDGTISVHSTAAQDFDVKPIGIIPIHPKDWTAVENLCFCGSPEASVASQRKLLQQHSESGTSLALDGRSESSKERPRNWNVFLVDRSSHGVPRPHTARILATSIYSLSSPSIFSPSMFAGLEGNVIQVDATSVYDRFPDPLFSAGHMNSKQNSGNRGRSQEQIWALVDLRLSGNLGSESSIMALNWVMLDANHKFVPLPRERVYFTSHSRTTLSLQTPNSYPGKEPLSISSSGGTAYITNQRIVYLPTSPTAQLQSFSAPVLNLQDTHVDAPFFGANSWTGILKPVNGGGIPAHHAFVKLSMTFKDGGAFDFATIYERIKETMSQAIEVARESGRQTQGSNLSDVNLEQLPAYEEMGTTVSVSDPPPIQQPLPISPTVSVQGSSRDSGVMLSSDDERIPKPQPIAPAQQQHLPPDGPPPGYEEAQQSSVAENLERNLRISH
ncbi:MAG: hypothetical protein Q9220_004724 [cf. Caloplaca sp. 1 TL-2023]